ncbi:MAG: hypothetical protein V7746_00095 [Halioglobus sp.]
MNIYRPVLLLALAIMPLPAFAYIDPGSGSAIMSAVIGFVVASWLLVKTYWYKLKSLFQPGSRKSAEDQEESETEPTDQANSP